MNTDIRLKKITIDSSPLLLQNGYVNITDTTISDIYNASLNVNGGISIKTTSNSTSVTAGGALTIAGGMSVIKDTKLGGSIDINNSVRVLGGSVDKFNVSSGNIYASLDGITKHLEMSNNNLIVRTTGDSYNYSSGSAVFYGGVSIACGSNSNDTAGGALSIAGGMSVGQDIHSANVITGNVDIRNTNVITLHNNGTIQNTTMQVSGSNTILLTSTQGSFVVNNNCSIAQTSVNINTNMYLGTGSTFISNSLNQATFNSTQESTYTSSSIVINGGALINKMCVLGDSLHVTSNSNNKLDKIVLYQPQANPQSNNTSNSMCSIGMTSGNMTMNIASGSNLIVNNGLSKIFSLNYDNSFDFKTTHKIFLDTYNELSLRKSVAASDSIVNIISEDADGTDTVGLRITKNGSQNNWMFSGYDKNVNSYCIKASGNDTTGNTSVDLGIYNQTYCNIVFGSSGNVSLTPTQNGKFTIVNSGCNTIIEGGLAVGQSIRTSYGNLKIRDTVLEQITVVSGSAYSSICIHPDNSLNPMLSLYSTTLTSGNNAMFEIMSLGTPTSGSKEAFKIHNTLNNGNGFVIHTDSSGSGNNKYIGIQSTLSETAACSQLVLQTNGNVGIGITNPSVLLDINGGMKCLNQTASNINCLTLQVTGTSPTSILSQGGIQVTGQSVLQQALTVGSGIIANGIMLQDTAQNSIICSGGANIIGGISTGSITTNNIIINDVTSASVNGGSLKSLGGVCILSTANSTNVTSECALYVAGNIHNSGLIRVVNGINSYSRLQFDNAGIMLTAYDNSSVNRFMMRLDTSNNTIIGNTNGNAIELQTGSDNRIIFSNTVASTGLTTASAIFNGGITIKQTSASSSVSNGGALTVAGGASIAKNMNIGGDLIINSTTASVSSTTGCLTLNGGLGVSGNVNINGDTIISGNFTVYGQSTNLITTNTTLEDNVITLNSGPSGSRDSGMFIQRYQTDNDTGSGDVVNDTVDISGVLGSQTGMGSTSANLTGIATSTTTDYYVGWWIKITGGFDSNQVRKIIAYNGTTKVASISSAWTGSNPASGDTMSMYSKAYSGMVFNESNDRFECISSNRNVSDTLYDTTSYIQYNKFTTSQISCENVNIDTWTIDNNVNFGIYNNQTTGIFMNTYGCIAINTTPSTNALEVKGSVHISNDLTVDGMISSVSDIRLKENVVDIRTKNASILEAIMKLTPITYNLKDSDCNEPQIGLIAQELISAGFPELVNVSEDGYYSLDYSRISVLLLASIQELFLQVKSKMN